VREFERERPLEPGEEERLTRGRGTPLGSQRAAPVELKPSKLALHTTIRRIDAKRRESGEAAKWEQELAEMRKNLLQGHKKGHELIESYVSVKSERP
jgi:hypothetical protein